MLIKLMDSLVSISNKKQDKTYYIEISTPWGEHYYVRINGDIPLTMWIDMKVSSIFGFGNLFDGAIIPYPDMTKINPNDVLIEKHFGKNALLASLKVRRLINRARSERRSEKENNESN